MFMWLIPSFAPYSLTLASINKLNLPCYQFQLTVVDIIGDFFEAVEALSFNKKFSPVRLMEVGIGRAAGVKWRGSSYECAVCREKSSEYFLGNPSAGNAPITVTPR